MQVNTRVIYQQSHSPTYLIVCVYIHITFASKGELSSETHYIFDLLYWENYIRVLKWDNEFATAEGTLLSIMEK
jgi:hypothetical protein